MSVESPLHQFLINKIIPINLAGLDLSFTNSSLFMVLSLLVICIMFLMPFISAQLVPSRLQSFAEIIYSFVNSMVRDNAGEKAKKFVPLIFSIFIFILVCNTLGMAPYGFAVTSHLIVNFVLAACIFFTVLITGFYCNGLRFLSLFLPKGTPIILAPIMIIIEFISFTVRPFTLTIRLTANMIAGHILLKILAAFVISMGIIGGWVPLASMVVMSGFEFFVAIIQAYIFAILSCAYLHDALYLH